MVKPFQREVRWGQFWRHRWIILNLINQIAYGTEEDAQAVAKVYCGSRAFGSELFKISKKIIILE